MNPLLKGSSLDLINLDSFHPISNFRFLRKVVAKVVTQQLQRTLDEVDYLESFQSGFRPEYGTQIASIVLLDELWQEWGGLVYPSLLFFN